MITEYSQLYAVGCRGMKTRYNEAQVVVSDRFSLFVEKIKVRCLLALKAQRKFIFLKSCFLQHGYQKKLTDAVHLL